MSVEGRIRLKVFKKLFPWYALFFSSLITIEIIYSFIARGMVGIPFLFVCFVMLRYTYKDRVTYHAETTVKCIFLSILTFAISAVPMILFNLRVSFVFPVLVGILTTWILHIIGMKDLAEKRLRDLEEPKFDLDNCTEEQLRERCMQRFKRDVEYKTERAIKHFILKLPHEEIDINPEQSKKERYRFRKILK